jgi:DNA-binding transcriptional regulator PaaX
MNISPRVFHGLSVVFWMHHALTRPGSELMKSNRGRLYSLFKEMAEEAEERKWLRLRTRSANHYTIDFEPKAQRALFGIREPLSRWNYKWDDQWYWLLFDIPTPIASARTMLLRLLRREGFGLLQDSVWVTPFPPEIYIDALERLKSKYPIKMCILSGTAIPIDNDIEPAHEAWHWEKIYSIHEEYQQWLMATKTTIDLSSTHAIQDAFQAEMALWKNICTVDPFLPRCLWPDDYPGEKSWKLRERLLMSWAKASL